MSNSNEGSQSEEEVWDDEPLLPWIELKPCADFYGPFRLSGPSPVELEDAEAMWKYYAKLIRIEEVQQRHQLAKRIGSTLSNR